MTAKKKITGEEIAAALAKETDRDREKADSLSSAKRRIALVVAALSCITEELEADDADGISISIDVASAALQQAKECRDDIYCAS